MNPLGVHYQGIFVLVFLTCGWGLVALRKRTLRVVRSGNGAWVKGADSVTETHPMVTVLMPVKGVKSHSVDNWRTQVATTYPGHVEFVFIVESQEDLAFESIKAFIQHYQEEHGADADEAFSNCNRSQSPSCYAKCRGNQRTVALFVAGAASTCSQKLHNMLYGVEQAHADSEYTLFLDDDVTLHHRMIEHLVEERRKDPRVFMVTGYPYDLPYQDGTLFSYCVMAYHLPLLIFFMAFRSTLFAWGGCMLFATKELRSDAYGMLSKWRNGGYSDDMIAGSVTVANKRRLASPELACFPNKLEKNVTWHHYWNYIRRQTFTLTTYSDVHNKLTNSMLMFAYPYCSAVLVTSTALSCFQVLRLLVKLVDMRERRLDTLPRLELLMVCLWPCSLFIIMKMMNALSKLTEQLSGDGQGTSHGNFRAGLEATAFRTLLGLLLHNSIYPFCVLYTLCVPHINWGGIEYYRRGGLVSHIDRGRTMKACQSVNSSKY
mmetsp:Transcript_8504/g.31420  ORF Transcript_8504/g.31420 Transcript_8504/m.31420 type:complete len:489 (+) Transcript_8504:136-1602(+)